MYWNSGVSARANYVLMANHLRPLLGSLVAKLALAGKHVHLEAGFTRSV